MGKDIITSGDIEDEKHIFHIFHFEHISQIIVYPLLTWNK